jgi:putative peptide zinc metalloprotease protein
MLLMLATAALALMNADEVVSYGGYVLREHYLAIVIAGLLIGVTHEFAHGLTCKAFGGRATEIGALLIYYFLPALYCNVSGIHLIPQRGRRLWVIAAGVYWQLMVGTVALLAWFALAPYTLLADLAFVFFCGGVLDVAFNGNPLIKLDGYYFLSQLLRMPNLMDRSRAYWHGLWRRIVFGERHEDSTRFSRRERAILAAFGLASFIYTTALMVFIVVFVGGYLIDWYHLAGLLGTIGIGLFYMRQPLRRLVAATVSGLAGALANLKQFFVKRTDGKMANNDQTALPRESPGAGDQRQTQSGEHQPARWRRRLVPLSMALFVVMVLCLPWDASVGAYGSLVAIPEREAIIRAPESASLVTLRVSPGDRVAVGAVIGQMGNLDLEEQIIAVQSDLARVKSDYDRLSGELSAREEAIVRAETQLRQRQYEYHEIESERRQIAESQRPETGNAKIVPALALSTSQQFERSVASYPAALAALQAEVEFHRAQFEEGSARRDRARTLNAEDIVPRGEFEAAEVSAATLGSAYVAARKRLEAALVEHRRRHANTATEVNLASSDLSVERLQISRLEGELKATREVILTLEVRRDLLTRKRAQFELTTTRAGAIFGEALPRMAGQYFQKGAEICRIADTSQLLVRIQVPEREIGDVRVGQSVRLKAPAHPEIVFRGTVSKIGGESELNQHQQATYRVELMIENADGLLRPGMTAYSRIGIGRQMVGSILLHKIKQTLRPELWML